LPPPRTSSQGPPVKSLDAMERVAPAMERVSPYSTMSSQSFSAPAQTHPSALSQLPGPEVVVHNGTQVPLLLEHHLRTVHPVKLRDHAVHLLRTLGHDRVGMSVPIHDHELVGWIMNVQRIHLEPLREISVMPQNGLGYHTNGSQSARSLRTPYTETVGSVNSLWAPSQSTDMQLQAEINRRQAAESRVRELEALVTRLRQRITSLEGKRTAGSETRRGMEDVDHGHEDMIIDDPIDRAICEYLERNPDFPVSIQKVAPNYYVFGDRGTVYVTQRGEHIVVRVGGGFKSLQVFMDERALMVTRDAASALSEKMLMSGQLPM